MDTTVSTERTSDSPTSSPDDELELKREEIKLRRAELRLNTTVTVLVALFSAALGGAATAMIQGTTSKDVEQKRFEAQLILKAIQTGDRKASARNLLFLVEAGFIHDSQGRIAKLAKDPETVPVLPREGDGGGDAGGSARSRN